MSKIFLLSISLPFLFIILLSCTGDGESAVIKEKESQETVILANRDASYDSVAIGKPLFDSNCAGCHSIRMQLIGPPMNKYWQTGGVFTHYKKSIKSHNTLKIDSTQLRFIDAYINKNVVYIDP